MGNYITYPDPNLSWDTYYTVHHGRMGKTYYFDTEEEAKAKLKELNELDARLDYMFKNTQWCWEH